MSRPSWEYMTLTWTHSASGTDAALQYESMWTLRQGNSGVETQRSADDNLVDILADLGQDGWDLVSETLQSWTKIVRTGYPNSTTPLRVRWILKRPLDAQ